MKNTIASLIVLAFICNSPIVFSATEEEAEAACIAQADENRISDEKFEEYLEKCIADMLSK